MKLLDGKICIITGGGRGIGKATAEKFSGEGATVIIAENDEKTGQFVADALKGKFIKTDVSNQESVNVLFQSVMDAYTRVDVLVNNAGILMDSTLTKMDEDQFDSAVSYTHLRAHET